MLIQERAVNILNDNHTESLGGREDSGLGIYAFRPDKLEGFSVGNDMWDAEN